VQLPINPVVTAQKHSPMDSSVKVVRPTGILDSSQAGDFRQQIGDLVHDGARAVIVDFQDVTFMDSSGLGALVLALKTVRSAGAEMHVCSMNEQVKMLFELTSMDRVFKIFADADAVETWLAAQPSN
jgi:anti-anti-sigma factor